ncbi:MAG TPA: type II toxin-antitoxin system VapC family toxin [Bryobacteraceae bacterium]|nr:type II toxin-antitoxin system VapC family toxin [Bryobacteraceae bacterium]
MIVADASAVLEVVLNTLTGAAIANRLFAENQTIHAPHLIDVEVAQVLRRYARTKVMEDSRAREVIQDFRDLPITRYPQDILLERIWELRHNLPAYDGAYVALAEALDAPLITCDRALKSASGHQAEILVF